MGAEIRELSATRCALTGPQRLVGAPVDVPDIRSGTALLLAGLAASGETHIADPSGQIARGHHDLPAKLRALGAGIEDVTDDA